jgi:hypothetical protein
MTKHRTRRSDTSSSIKFRLLRAIAGRCKRTRATGRKLDIIRLAEMGVI